MDINIIIQHVLFLLFILGTLVVTKVLAIDFSKSSLCLFFVCKVYDYQKRSFFGHEYSAALVREGAERVLWSKWHVQ